MSKINELINKLCPNGVDFKPLREVCIKVQDGNYGKDYPKVNELQKEGIALINGKAIHGKIVRDAVDYISEEKNDQMKKARIYTDDVLFLNRGNIGETAMVTEEYNNCNIGPQVTLLRANQDFIRPKFLEYILHSKHVRKIINTFTGSTIKFVSVEPMRNMIIPVPPLEVQEEIVRILDKFGELEANLETELEARKSQYEFWRDILFELDDCEWKTTEEVFDTITDYVANGSFKSIADNVSYKNEKDYAVLLRTVDYSNDYDENKFIYIDEHAYNFLEKSKLFGGEIIINNIGAGVGTTFLCPDLGMPMSLAPNTIMLRTPNNKFYYYWFNSKRGQESIESVTAKSAMPKFNKTGFRKLLVPVPPIEKQNKIVSILDKFDKLINDISEGLPAEIELRRKQYEYYRNKLLSFEELSVSE